MTRFLATIWVLLPGAALLAGGTPEHLLDDESLLRDWRRDVYVVRVKSVMDKGATNARPPTVVLLIKETLRGNRESGAVFKAIWYPFPHGIDTPSREGELETWNQKSLRGPKVGDELIVMGYDCAQRDPFPVSPRCRFQFSREKRDKNINVCCSIG